MRLDGRACLGLVLAVTGIRALPDPLQLVVQWTIVDGWSTEVLLVCLPLLVVLLQIAAGCAFAFGAQGPGKLALAGYVASAVMGPLVFGFVELGADRDGLTIVATLIETLGQPILVVVALAIGRPPGSTRRTEVGVLLIVIGVSGIVGIAIQTISLLHAVVKFGRVDAGALSMLLWIGIYLTIAILAVRAGLQLRRGIAGAHRALGVYVIAALAGELVIVLLALGVAAFDDLHPLVIAIRVVGAIDGLALPLLLWAFVRRDREPGTDPHLPMSAAWFALLIVPFLAARPLIVDAAATPLVGATLAMVLAGGFAALTIATTLAAGAALRERMSATSLAVAASVLGVVVTCAMVVIQQLEELGPPRIQTGPLVSLVVTTAVLAWLHRTATPPLPRAVVRR